MTFEIIYYDCYAYKHMIYCDQKNALKVIRNCLFIRNLYPIFQGVSLQLIPSGKVRMIKF